MHLHFAPLGEATRRSCPPSPHQAVSGAPHRVFLVSITPWKIWYLFGTKKEAGAKFKACDTRHNVTIISEPLIALGEVTDIFRPPKKRTSSGENGIQLFPIRFPLRCQHIKNPWHISDDIFPILPSQAASKMANQCSFPYHLFLKFLEGRRKNADVCWLAASLFRQGREGVVTRNGDALCHSHTSRVIWHSYLSGGGGEGG